MPRSESESWSSFANRSFRSSIGRRRKSLPSSSSRSNAQCTAEALLPCPRIRSKTASPFSSQTIASPSIMHDRTGSDLSAIAMAGKWSVKSLPLRVMSRTPVRSRRARIRKPSCLISCSQPGPEGGAFAEVGKHGSTIPSRGAARSLRSDILYLVGIAAQRVEWGGRGRQIGYELFGKSDRPKRREEAIEEGRLVVGKKQRLKNKA